MRMFRVNQPRWQLTSLVLALAATGMLHSPQALGACPVGTVTVPWTVVDGDNCQGVDLGADAELINEGTISWVAGTDAAVKVTARATSLDNRKGALIIGSTNGGGVFGISVSIGAELGSLTNDGTIEGKNPASSSSIYTTAIDNQGIIGNLTNNNKINGDIQTTSGSLGFFTNNGDVVGAVTYNGDKSTPILKNNAGASIRKDTSGVNVIKATNSAVVYVTNAGVIASRLSDDDAYADDSYGVTFEGGQAELDNQRGGVIGGMTGVRIGNDDGDTTTVKVTNAGTIDGNTGIYVNEGGTISSLDNKARGKITSIGSRSMRVFGSIETLTNEGLIQGMIELGENGAINSLTNHDVIRAVDPQGTGVSGTALRNNFGGTLTTLTNEATGKIEGKIEGAIGTLTNKGLIDGEVSITSAATLNIEGDSARIAGTVTAASSTVNLSGTFTTENTFDVDVFNIVTGGTLTLAHKITTGPNSFHNDGTMIVAAGTQEIVGNFTTTGTFSPVIVDMGNYGKLAVDGDVELSGTLKANNGITVQGLSEGTLTDIISYTGSRTGEFDEVVGANELFAWSVEYDDAGKRVNLVLEQTSSGFYESVSTAGFVPAYQAALALDTIALADATNPVVLSFVNVPQAQVADAVVQTLPLLTGNSQLAAMNALNDIDDAVKARLDFNRGELTDGAMFTDRKIWIRPFGSWVDQQNRGNDYGYSGSTGGLVVGADANVATGLQMGLAFGYAKSNITGNTPIQRNTYDLDTYQVLGYGRYELGQGTELEFQAGVGMNTNKGTRQISFAGSTAKSSYDSTTVSAGLGLRHQLRLNASTTFTPEVRADYGWISDAGYTETGAQALNLIVQGRDHDQLMLSAGGSMSYEIESGLALRAGLAVGYDALNSQAQITSAYSGAPQTTFVTDGINPSPWQLMGSLALVGELANGMQVSASYGASWRQDFLNQNVSLNLRIGF
jgi:outer membrane autotransporter protein